MFPDNADWLHGPDSNHDLDLLRRRGGAQHKPAVMVRVSISTGADISTHVLIDQVFDFVPIHLIMRFLGEKKKGHMSAHIY